MANTMGGVFGVLNPDCRQARDGRSSNRPIDTGLGFTLTPFVTPGKIPLYLESANEARDRTGRGR